MIIVCLFFIVWGVCASVKALPVSRRRIAAPAPVVSTVSKSLAALEALQAQRDELQDQLDLINAALDAAPPEAKRLRWMKERSRVYGQLATCESTISRLCGA